MPITVTCEHCGAPAAYATTVSDEYDGFTLINDLDIRNQRRHICHNIECLEKEIKHYDSNFWFQHPPVDFPVCTRKHVDDDPTDIPF